MSLNHIYRVVARGAADGQEIINHLDYKAVAVGVNATEVDDNDMLQLATGFAARWNSEIAGLLGTSYSIREYRCKEIIGATGLATLGARASPTFGREAVYSFPDPIEGEGANPVTPTTEAIGVRKITADGSTYFRGSMRLGPLSEAYTLNNRVLDEVVTEFQTAMNNMIANLVIDDETDDEILFQAGIFSAKHLVVFTPAQVKDSWRQLQTVLVNQWVTTQRSRHRRA